MDIELSGSAGRRKEVLPYCWSTMHFMKFYKQNRENRVQSALKTAENALPRLWRVLERSVITVPCQRLQTGEKQQNCLTLNANPGAPFPHKALDRSYKAGSCLFNIEVKDQIEALILILGKQIPQCHIEPSAKLSKNTKVGKLQKCPKNPKCVWCLWCFQNKKRYKWMACILPLAHNFFIQGAAQLRRFLLSLPGRELPEAEV